MRGGNVQEIDLSKITKEHENKWVALATDTYDVLAAGENLRDLRSQLDERADRVQVIFHRVIPADVSFAP